MAGSIKNIESWMLDCGGAQRQRHRHRSTLVTPAGAYVIAPPQFSTVKIFKVSSSSHGSSPMSEANLSVNRDINVRPYSFFTICNSVEPRPRGELIHHTKALDAKPNKPPLPQVSRFWLSSTQPQNDELETVGRHRQCRLDALKQSLRALDQERQGPEDCSRGLPSPRHTLLIKIVLEMSSHSPC